MPGTVQVVAVQASRLPPSQLSQCLICDIALSLLLIHSREPHTAMAPPTGAPPILICDTLRKPNAGLLSQKVLHRLNKLPLRLGCGHCSHCNWILRKVVKQNKTPKTLSADVAVIPPNLLGLAVLTINQIPLLLPLGSEALRLLLLNDPLHLSSRSRLYY